MMMSCRRLHKALSDQPLGTKLLAAIHILIMLCTAFAHYGAVVQATASTQEAFEVMVHWQPDVSVCDLTNY